MKKAAPGAPREGFPQSPCVDICALSDNNICLGCFRTVDEIIAWSRMSAEQQWQVIAELPERRE